MRPASLSSCPAALTACRNLTLLLLVLWLPFRSGVGVGAPSPITKAQRPQVGKHIFPATRENVLLPRIPPLESSMERAEWQKSSFFLETYGKQFVCLEENHSLLFFFPLEENENSHTFSLFHPLFALCFWTKTQAWGEWCLLLNRKC